MMITIWAGMWLLAVSLMGEVSGTVAQGNRDTQPCQLTLREGDRVKLDSNTHETAFHGDAGSTFTLSWVGDGTGVILVLSTVSAPLGLFPESGSSKLYRSADYGKTFHDISSAINNTLIQKDFGISTGPGNSLQVILTADVPISERRGGLIFTSVDAGVSFRAVQLPFHPSQQISFHLQNPDYLLVISTEAALWLSTDFGHSWSKIHEAVHSFMWGPGITLFLSSVPSGIVDSDRRGKLLLRRTQDMGKSFHTVANNTFSFGYIGDFLFASIIEKPGEPRIISVSSDLGETFYRAQLPSATKEQFYSVLDADEDMIFMHVDNPGDTNFGTIYTSDDRGVAYSKSLERHLFGGEGKSDFTNITSLHGVYLTNVLEEGGRIRTVITSERGAKWRPLNQPENVECPPNTQNCNLHVHGEYSHSKGWAPMLPLSDPSAVGLIIAHGSVGDSLNPAQADVYISSDGGYSWALTLRGPHHYAVLDSGGLLVAVEAYGNRLVNTVKFSTDEGQCWTTYNFSEQPVFFAGLTSEPGAKTLNISIWGYRMEKDYRATWVSITVDFQCLITRECEEQDYELWLAHSNLGGDLETRGCVLGYRETFQRLKKLSVCRNGRGYAVSREQSPCTCTFGDYLCDYGYYRHKNTSECLETSDSQDKSQNMCLEEEEIHSTGYRKVPGDRCEGGFIPTRTPRPQNNHCKEAVELSSPKQTVLVVTVAVCAALGAAALVIAALLIARKHLYGRSRIPAYRFSALQLQDDDRRVIVEQQPVTNYNNRGCTESDEVCWRTSEAVGWSFSEDI